LDKKLKSDIIEAIDSPLPLDMDESDCCWWMSRVAEAKRYVERKIKVCNRKINDLDLELEILNAEIGKKVRLAGEGTATERKSIIEDRYTTHKDYKVKWKRIYDYQALIADYQADLDNLNEKSFAVRKIADFLRVHMMYEDE
jgi:hypothetical protein